MDCNPLSLEATCAILGRWKLKYTAVVDAREAREQLERSATAGHAYDILLVDRSAVDSGGASLRGASDDTGLGSPASILFVPLGTKVDHERLGKGGFESSLTKPLKPSSLLDSIVVVLADAPGRGPGGRT